METPQGELEANQDETYVFSGDPEKDQQGFMDYARRHTKPLPLREFYSWMQENTGKAIYGATAWFVVNKVNENEFRFKSAVNMGGFKVDGLDFSDLYPFVVEHEAFEGYQKCKQGFDHQNEGSKHDAAMEREYAMAAAQGKADRLLEWMTRIAPNKVSAYRPAYDKATGGSSNT